VVGSNFAAVDFMSCPNVLRIGNVVYSLNVKRERLDCSEVRTTGRFYAADGILALAGDKIIVSEGVAQRATGAYGWPCIWARHVPKAL
jgi:hypothetical protein